MPEPVARRAVIALGSNLGRRHQTLAAAVAALDGLAEVTVRAVSPVHETVAVSLDGPDPDRPRFANAVAVVSTTLSAERLLAELQRIEREHHRVRHERWGDRTLDLDLIDYAGEIRDSPALTIPHPRAAEREFVLAPWAEIEPEAVLAGTPIRTLLARLQPQSPESTR